MLRFGAVLLAGLLVLSGCSQGGASNSEKAKADQAFLEACNTPPIGVWDGWRKLKSLKKAAKLNPEYQHYLDRYFYFMTTNKRWGNESFWTIFKAKCQSLE